MPTPRPPRAASLFAALAASSALALVAAPDPVSRDTARTPPGVAAAPAAPPSPLYRTAAAAAVR